MNKKPLSKLLSQKIKFKEFRIPKAPNKKTEIITIKKYKGPQKSKDYDEESIEEDDNNRLKNNRNAIARKNRQRNVTPIDGKLSSFILHENKNKYRIKGASPARLVRQVSCDNYYEAQKKRQNKLYNESIIDKNKNKNNNHNNNCNNYVLGSNNKLNKTDDIKAHNDYYNIINNQRENSIDNNDMNCNYNDDNPKIVNNIYCVKNRNILNDNINNYGQYYYQNKNNNYNNNYFNNNNNDNYNNNNTLDEYNNNNDDNVLNENEMYLDDLSKNTGSPFCFSNSNYSNFYQNKSQIRPKNYFISKNLDKLFINDVYALKGDKPADNELELLIPKTECIYSSSDKNVSTYIEQSPLRNMNNSQYTQNSTNDIKVRNCKKIVQNNGIEDYNIIKNLYNKKNNNCLLKKINDNYNKKIIPNKSDKSPNKAYNSFINNLSNLNSNNPINKSAITNFVYSKPNNNKISSYKSMSNHSSNKGYSSTDTVKSKKNDAINRCLVKIQSIYRGYKYRVIKRLSLPYKLIRAQSYLKNLAKKIIRKYILRVLKKYTYSLLCKKYIHDFNLNNTLKNYTNNNSSTNKSIFTDKVKNVNLDKFKKNLNNNNDISNTIGNNSRRGNNINRSADKQLIRVKAQVRSNKVSRHNVNENLNENNRYNKIQNNKTPDNAIYRRPKKNDDDAKYKSFKKNLAKFVIKNYDIIDTSSNIDSNNNTNNTITKILYKLVKNKAKKLNKILRNAFNRLLLNGLKIQFQRSIRNQIFKNIIDKKDKRLVAFLKHVFNDFLIKGIKYQYINIKSENENFKLKKLLEDKQKLNLKTLKNYFEKYKLRIFSQKLFQYNSKQKEITEMKRIKTLQKLFLNKINQRKEYFHKKFTKFYYRGIYSQMKKRDSHTNIQENKSVIAQTSPAPVVANNNVNASTITTNTNPINYNYANQGTYNNYPYGYNNYYNYYNMPNNNLGQSVIQFANNNNNNNNNLAQSVIQNTNSSNLAASSIVSYDNKNNLPTSTVLVQEENKNNNNNNTVSKSVIPTENIVSNEMKQSDTKSKDILKSDIIVDNNKPKSEEEGKKEMQNKGKNLRKLLAKKKKDKYETLRNGFKKFYLNGLYKELKYNNKKDRDINKDGNDKSDNHNPLNNKTGNTNNNTGNESNNKESTMKTEESTLAKLTQENNAINKKMNISIYFFERKLLLLLKHSFDQWVFITRVLLFNDDEIGLPKKKKKTKKKKTFKAKRSMDYANIQNFYDENGNLINPINTNNENENLINPININNDNDNIMENKK